jgi:hypothetical protein
MPEWVWMLLLAVGAPCALPATLLLYYYMTMVIDKIFGTDLMEQEIEECKKVAGCSII